MHTTTRTRDLPTNTSSEAPPVPQATPNRARKPRGVSSPAPDERRRPHRLVVVGVVAVVVTVVMALVLTIVARTDDSPAAEADVARGPNVDLPVDRTVTDAAPVRVATDTARGPNADLPPDLISQNAATQARANATNRGPNADLPVDRTAGATTEGP